ncbi:MAG: pantetheine-phosphate adenylyltransferase [Thermodesulfobacteriota bacterium]
MNRIAAFPGTFDPITNGHLDIVKRGLNIFDELIVAVAENPQKGTLFSTEERVEMVRESLAGFPSVKVESFGNLLIDYLREKNINVAIRGLRVMSDFEHEFQMALINRKLDPRIETVFMMTSEESSYISSRFLKEIFRLGGKVDCFVPLPVIKKLKEKMGTDNG